MHSSVLKSHHFLHNDRRGKKLGDPNWYLAAAFRTSTLFYQRFRAFWCCCIHLARCSITAVCLVCPQAVGLCTKHLKACLLWVYRLCPAVQEVYFHELLFFFFLKRHVSAGSSNRRNISPTNGVFIYIQEDSPSRPMKRFMIKQHWDQHLKMLEMLTWDMRREK